MTIYSLYIFDRHCTCVFYHEWQRATPTRMGSTTLPGVMRVSGAAVPPSHRPSQPSHGQATAHQTAPEATLPVPKGLPFDEEAKLVYGVVFSLRNMVKRLSGKDDSFISFRTSAYKLHYFSTPTGFRFILLSDPAADSLRFVLRQIYTGAFLEYVIRNPLIGLDSAQTGRGIDSDAFRSAVDGFVKSLSVS